MRSCQKKGQEKIRAIKILYKKKEWYGKVVKEYITYYGCGA